jgi:hypothetical protein
MNLWLVAAAKKRSNGEAAEFALPICSTTMSNLDNHILNPKPPHVETNLDTVKLRQLVLDSTANIIQSYSFDSIPQLLDQFEGFLQYCEVQHEYSTAAMCQLKITELKQHYKQELNEVISYRHLTERYSVDQAEHEEINEYNNYWQQKLEEFDKESQSKLEELEATQAKYIEVFNKEQQERLLMRPKYSKKLLDLRAIQQTMARSKQYEQAEALRTKANVLQTYELHLLKQNASKTIEIKRNNLMQQQRTELEIFHKRRFVERELLEKQRAIYLEAKIIQKYRNLKQELSRAQNKELIQINKYGPKQAQQWTSNNLNFNSLPIHPNNSQPQPNPATAQSKQSKPLSSLFNSTPIDSTANVAKKSSNSNSSALSNAESIYSSKGLLPQTLISRSQRRIPNHKGSSTARSAHSSTSINAIIANANAAQSSKYYRPKQKPYYDDNHSDYSSTKLSYRELPTIERSIRS